MTKPSLRLLDFGIWTLDILWTLELEPWDLFLAAFAGFCSKPFGTEGRKEREGRRTFGVRSVSTALDRTKQNWCRASKVVNPFPEQWELLSFFECEPKLEDRDVPWAYNHLTFNSIRGSNRILCVIEPGYECLEFTWWHNQTKHLELKLRWVHGITISSGGGTDFMIAKFRDSCLLPLRLQLKPTIECEWGTTHDCP